LGANWIHGINGNPLYEIVQTVPGSTYEQGKNLTITAKGELIDTTESDAIQTEFWDTVAFGCEFSKRYSEWISPQTSFYDFCERKASLIYNKSTATGKRSYERFMALSEMWGAFVGSDVRMQSLKFFFLEELLDGRERSEIMATWAPLLTFL
jgi:hypothetical protein